MSTTILPVKPGTISEPDKTALREAGIIVIEVESPAEIRLLRAESEISASGFLHAALKGLTCTSLQDKYQIFTSEIAKQVATIFNNEEKTA